MASNGYTYYKILGALLLGSILLITGSVSAALYQPPEEKPYAGITISFVCDSGHLYWPWYSEKYPELNAAHRIENLYGLKLKGTAKSPGEVFPTIMADLLSEAGVYNILIFFPMHNGDLMGGQYLVPLNEYIKKYPVEWWDIYPIYRTLYCMWGKTIYALPYDGDCLLLYYRKDIFSDPEIKKKFKNEYGFDLAPPKTYAEYNSIAKFFTGWDWDNDGEKEYGTVEYFKRDMGYGYWVSRFGSAGGVYFDENMNPMVNTEAGVQALKDYKAALDNSPPGAIAYGAVEVFDTFLNGVTAMALTWPDIGPRVGTGRFKVKPEQVGFALVPGYRIDGKLLRRSWAGPGRVMAISKFTPKEKREAAFQVIRYMSSPATSLLHTSNGETGTDSFRYSHDQSPELWVHKYPTLEKFVQAKLLNAEHGYPGLYLRGQEEYMDALTRNIQDYFLEKISAEKAMDNVAREWKEITSRIGIERQKRDWSKLIMLYKQLGIWIE